MKKLFIAAILVAAIGTSAFASDAGKVNFRVKNNFEAQFADATNVQWTLTSNYAKASFELNDETVDAFYSLDGEAIGISHKVNLKKLPLKAIQKIRKDYSTYTVVETISFEQDGEKSFYVSLADGNKKQIVQVSVYGNVSPYNPVK